MTMLKVQLCSLDAIRPYINNARVHSSKQISQIAKLISEFGFTNPLLVSSSGDLIAGHGRLLAARKLSMTDVPVIVLEGLAEAQVRALRLADNKIALNSGWDADLLKVELGELMAMDLEVDLAITGFSGGEIDVLIAPAADPDEDVVPAVRTKPRTQLGDIWQLGRHRVGCGDCRDPEFLRVVTEDRRVDCAFLDPPYNVRIAGHANVKSHHREFAMASGEMSASDFRGFLSDTLGHCSHVSRDGAVHFVCMDWRHQDDLAAVGGEVYGEQLNLCVWNKSNAGMRSLYRSKHEFIFVYRVGNGPHLNAVELGRHGRNRTNVWDYASVNTFRGSRRADLALHPTVKPTALVADAIQDVTRRGDLVLDAFLGAGTTLLACERVGRVFCGLDIDPSYVDVALDRWTAMTGRQALRVRGDGHAQ